MDENRKTYLTSLKTYELRNRLLELLDTNTNWMSESVLDQHNTEKTVIRAEIAKRKNEKV